MTKEEIAVLGHAFFDGKTLQFSLGILGDWEDWTSEVCPRFNHKIQKWRIKPDEPKTITICTFMHIIGEVQQVVKDSDAFVSISKNQQWTHIKSLDQARWWSDDNR